MEILAGDIIKELNPRSGREMSVMTGMAVPVRMKDYGVFAATRSVPLPAGWIIPRADAESGRLAAAIDRLRWHGIQIEKVTEPSQMQVERFVIDTVVRAERVFQGHHEARLKGRMEKAVLSVEPGALFISARQPLGRLAFYLLEPESDDGLVTWNVIEQGLAAGQAYPIYRVM